MAMSFCRQCDAEFFYDADAGVNVKYYEPEANARTYQGGGVFPICPDCDAKCRTEAAINYDKNQIRIERKFFLESDGKFKLK